MRRITIIPLISLALLFALSNRCSAQAENPSSGSLPPQANSAGAEAGPMVRVPGGTMQMGISTAEIPSLQNTFHIDRPELFQDEVPKHSVTLDAFHIDKFPVTNAQFKKFTDAHPEWQADRIPRALNNGDYLKHWKEPTAFTTKADHPVVNVNWYAAVAYCRWAGKRLPTEAEWEHAARGGLNALFPWGDQPVDNTRANFSGSGLGTTSPVGSYPANGFGLFDMAGNVWQFLADEWKPYSAAPQKNPVAGGNLFVEGDAFLQVKTRRVIRGGSFGGGLVNFWVEYRDSHSPENARDFVGFRCAK
jgi:formylglycine-generating enzyme required for sulfatase activity